jgi:hypothetical protein
MFTYRITYLIGKIETSPCPSPVVSALFPNFNGEPVTASETEITVTFSEPQTPTDLGALVRVELMPNSEQ